MKTLIMYLFMLLALGTIVTGVYFGNDNILYVALGFAGLGLWMDFLNYKEPKQ